jgi:hypothetical protein
MIQDCQDLIARAQCKLKDIQFISGQFGVLQGFQAQIQNQAVTQGNRLWLIG